MSIIIIIFAVLLQKERMPDMEGRDAGDSSPIFSRSLKRGGESPALSLF